MHERMIAALRRLYGDRDPRMATAVMNLGVTRLRLNQPDLALVQFERAIELLSSVSGEDSPHLDLFYSNAGEALLALRRPAEAKAAYERAFSLQKDRPPGSFTVIIYGGLANAENELEHPDAAIEMATKGLEVADAVGEPALYRWILLMARASARGKLGDIAGQSEDCGRVLALQKAQGPLASAGPYGPDSLRCLGETELARHRVDAALSYLEQSVSLEHRYAPYELALARFTLARALRVADRSPARSEELARSALDTLRSVRGEERDVAAIERWLEERGAGERRAAPATRGPASETR